MSKNSNNNLVNKEIWKDIKGYEGYYQVSNKGRVKSLDRKYKDGSSKKGHVIKQLKEDDILKVRLVKYNQAKVYNVKNLKRRAFGKNLDDFKGKVNEDFSVKVNDDFKGSLSGLPDIGERSLHFKVKVNDDFSNQQQIALIQNNKIIKICANSRQLAEWLIKNNLVKNGNIETVARKARLSANKGNSYYGYYFQFIK